MAELPDELLQALQKLDPELYKALHKGKHVFPVPMKQGMKPESPAFDSRREENNLEKVTDFVRTALEAVSTKRKKES